MSLRINTNVPAMTAMRQLQINEQTMQGSITRLSTGLRINSAGDDPAGMIISESLRSQIKGVQQAVRNSQDAVNMTKTAEGALEEVSRLLLSLRAVAVGSANTAVMDNNQLQANQMQIREAVRSLERISDQTAWGNRKLLNGATGAVANITNTNLVSSAFFGGEMNGLTMRSGPITMQQTTAATRTTTGAMATTFADGGSAVNTGTFAINGVSFSVTAGMTVNDVVSLINQQSNLTNVTATFTAGSGVTLTSTKFGANYPIRYTETNAMLNGGNPSTPALGVNAVYNVTVPAEPSPNTATEVFTGGQGPETDGLTLTSPTGNRIVVTSAGNATGALTTIGSVNVGAVRFQIGSNASQFASFSLPSVDPTQLGTGVVMGQSIASLDVTTEAGATNAIRIIDAAISQMATVRGRLGSFQQNFLQSNIRSLGVAEENLTASESLIRDADMAAEMTEYTKVQILRQSTMAVLAQANQAPQSVLSLLRGG